MWRILVVDDEVMITRSVTRILRGRAAVTCAYSPVGAILTMGVCPPFDAVWSDHHIPWAGAGTLVLQTAAELLPEAMLWMVTGDPSCDPAHLPPHTQVYRKPDLLTAANDLCHQLRLRSQTRA